MTFGQKIKKLRTESNLTQKDLADKILAITTDDNIQKQITESCHIRALQYDIDIMVNNYLLIYKQNYKPRTNTTA